MERVSMETPFTAKSPPVTLPPVAEAISSAVQSGSAMDRPQGRGDLGHIIEGMHHTGDGQPLLVSLASHHQNVAAAHHGHGGLDGLSAVADLTGFRRPGQDLG